jgi:spore coat protein CotH
MKKESIEKGIAILLAVALVIPLFISVVGCTGQAAGHESAAPFYEDRVVTVRFVMPEDDWNFMKKNARAEQYVKADLWFDGELIRDIALRPKGNSSLNTTVGRGSIRFSLKADLNFFNSARNLYGVKKLNFNNGFSDPTFMRETLAYDLFEYIGMPASRTSFVDLWINDTHMGLYTMVEQVDKTFLANHFSNSNGNLYKPVMPAASLKWTEEDYLKFQEDRVNSGEDETPDTTEINLGGGNLNEILRALGQGETEDQESIAPGGFARPGDVPLPGTTPNNRRDFVELMSLKTNENKPDHTGLFRFLEILNNEPGETFKEEIEKVLDVDQVLRFLAVSTVLVHLDNYIGPFGHNYYLYEIDGKFTVIPWDLNMSFGTFNAGLDRNGIINYFIDEPTAVPVAERPLVSRILSVPEYLETYHEYLSELVDGPFSFLTMADKIDETAAMIRPYVETDTLKFFSTRQFEVNLRQGITPKGNVPGMQLSIGLRAFVRERGDSIREQLNGTLPTTNNGKGNEGDFRMPGFNNRRPGNIRPPGR